MTHLHEDEERNMRVTAAAFKMYDALNGLREYAQEKINDLGADIQEGGKPTERWNRELAKWTKVLNALAAADPINPDDGLIANLDRVTE